VSFAIERNGLPGVLNALDPLPIPLPSALAGTTGASSARNTAAAIGSQRPRRPVEAASRFLLPD